MSFSMNISRSYTCASIVIDLIFIRDPIILRTGLKIFIGTLLESLRRSLLLSKLRFQVKVQTKSDCTKIIQQNVGTGASTSVSQYSPNFPGLIDVDRILFIPTKLWSTIRLQNGSWVALSQASIDNSNGNSNALAKFICQISYYQEEMENADVSAGADAHCSERLLIQLILSTTAEYNLRRTCRLSQFLRTNSQEFRLSPVLSDVIPTVLIASSSGYFQPRKATLLELTPLQRTDEILDVELDISLKMHFQQERYLSAANLISVPLGARTGPNCSIPVFNLVVTKIQSENNELNYQNQVLLVSVDYTTLFIRPASANKINAYHPRDMSPSHIPPMLLTYSQQIVNILTLGAKASNFGHGSSILMSGGCGSELSLICSGAAKRIGANLFTVNTINLIGDTSAYTESKLKNISQQIKCKIPCLVMMKNIHLLGKDKEGREDKRVILAFRDFVRECQTLSMAAAKGEEKLNSFLIGLTHRVEKVSQGLTQSFNQHIRVPQLMSNTKEDKSVADGVVGKNRDREMLDVIQWIIRSYEINFHDDICNWIMISGLSRKPSLKDFDDVIALVAAAVRKAYEESRSEIDALSPSVDLDEKNRGRKSCFKKLTLNASHLIEALDELESGFGFGGDNLEYGRIPKVNWEDIGGLAEIKSELINSIQLPLRFPHFFQSGLMRSGILLYGPPGTGKTLVAKAVATEFKLGFISVKGPELLNMYVGQSEQNVREVFQKARACAPCVVFFDELDALAPNRGKSGDSGGVMDRVVSQILAEMDGTHNKPSVFILGATNRPDLIDPALLRPGRFDKLLYIGVSSDKDTRKKILQALTRKFNLSPDVDLDQISERLPSGMTGADLSSLCSSAYMAAAERRISLLETGISTDANTSVYVFQEDFEKIISQVTVSLSPNDISKYEKLSHMTR